MNRLILATIVVGLAVDQYGGALGQLAVSIAAWAVFARL
jgi:hypothetical protein